jgi:hypothetical protein
MTLDEYLVGSDKTAAELSRETGLSAASITRIRRGEQNISIDVARLIVDATRGAVTADDLLRARASADSTPTSPSEAA